MIGELAFDGDTPSWVPELMRLMLSHDLKCSSCSLALSVCPVCWKPVAVSNVNRMVYSHHDKAGTDCPMGGHALSGLHARPAASRVGIAS